MWTIYMWCVQFCSETQRPLLATGEHSNPLWTKVRGGQVRATAVRNRCTHRSLPPLLPSQACASAPTSLRARPASTARTVTTATLWLALLAIVSPALARTEPAVLKLRRQDRWCAPTAREDRQVRDVPAAQNSTYGIKQHITSFISVRSDERTSVWSYLGADVARDCFSSLCLTKPPPHALQLIVLQAFSFNVLCNELIMRLMWDYSRVALNRERSELPSDRISHCIKGPNT